MTNIVELQKALENRPNLYRIPSNLTEHLKFETQIIEWFDNFENLFSAFLKDFGKETSLEGMKE